MRVDALTPVLRAAPGERATCRLRIENTDAGPLSYGLRVVGFDENQVLRGPPTGPLASGSVEEVELEFLIPDAYAAGHHSVAVEVTPDRPGSAPVIAGVTVAVGQIDDVAMAVVPSTVPRAPTGQVPPRHRQPFVGAGRPRPGGEGPGPPGHAPARPGRAPPGGPGTHRRQGEGAAPPRRRAAPTQFHGDRPQPLRAELCTGDVPPAAVLPAVAADAARRPPHRVDLGWGPRCRRLSGGTNAARRVEPPISPSSSTPTATAYPTPPLTSSWTPTVTECRTRGRRWWRPRSLPRGEEPQEGGSDVPTRIVIGGTVKAGESGDDEGVEHHVETDRSQPAGHRWSDGCRTGGGEPGPHRMAANAPLPPR